MLARRRLLVIALVAALVIPAALLAQAGGSPNGTFSVTGKVNHPGTFDLRDGMRVFDALGMARGFVEFANRKKITTSRGSERYNFDYDAFIRGKNAEQNIPLEDGDVIDVP